MMSRWHRHLSDEELIRVRDGECADPGQRAHVEACEYCQAVLEEWQRFQRLVAGRVPRDVPGVRPVTGTVDLRAVTPDQKPDLQMAAFFPSDVEPTVTPPNALIEQAVSRLSQAPRRQDLGAFTVHLRGDSAPRIEAAGAVGSTGEEATYRIANGQLHLRVRIAGLSTLLVARIDGPWITENDRSYDLTLVDRRHGVQSRALWRDPEEIRGMAWFRLPNGGSELLIHLDETWRLRLQKKLP